jgi:hypothetical protein
MLAELLVPKKTHVRWTDEEWDELADRVWKKRARCPEMTLWELINSVQEQQADPTVGRTEWPEDRKRKLNGLKLCEPIIPRLRKLDLELHGRLEREIPSLQNQIESLRQRPDKETLLAGLCEEEILRRFTDTVFRSFSPGDIIGQFKIDDVLRSVPVADVLAFAFRELFGNINLLSLQLAQHVNDHSLHHANGKSNGHANGNGHAKVKGIPPFKPAPLPRIAFLGLQQHHLEILKSHIGDRCEIVYVPKGDTKQQIELPDADHYVLWEINVSANNKRQIQKTHHENLLVHSGTFNEMIPRVQSLSCMGRGKVKPR